jgi:hypothetical protein
MDSPQRNPPFFPLDFKVRTTCVATQYLLATTTRTTTTTIHQY